MDAHWLCWGCSAHAGLVLGMLGIPTSGTGAAEIGQWRDVQHQSIPARPVPSSETLWHPLLTLVRVCRPLVPGSKQRSQPGVRCRGQWVPVSRHSLGSSDLNMGFACLSGRGEITPGMKISFGGWEKGGLYFAICPDVQYCK